MRLIIQGDLRSVAYFKDPSAGAAYAEWLCILPFSLLFFALADIVADVRYSGSQYGVWVQALSLRAAWEEWISVSFFFLHPSHI